MTNLPPGLSVSGIPGNSEREIRITRGMEDTDDTLDGIGLDLRELAKHFPITGGPEDAQHTIRTAREALETIQAKLDEADDVVQRLMYGDEPEYDPCP